MMQSVRLLLAVMLALSFASGSTAQELVDRIVAVVEDEPVLLSDVDNALAELLYVRNIRGEPMPGDSAEVAAIREELLVSIIERRIVIAKARKLGLEVSRTEVEDALDQWLDDLIAQTGSEAAFQMELERQGLNLQDLKAQYREDIEEQLVVSRFMRQEFSNVVVSEAEIQEFYDTKYDSIPRVSEKVGIAHIIIRTRISAEREDAALGRVDAVMTRVRAGEPFEQIALEMSDDVRTKADGGKIGTVSLGDLQEDLAGIAATLEPGQVSDAVRTRYGFEIVRLDAREGDVYTLSHVLIELSPERNDTLAAANRAYEVHDRIVAGESFEALAREHSDDIETKENGGFVGELEIDALDPTYREGLSQLQPGDVSDVIRTPLGFQILKLVSRTAGRTPGLDEARDWIWGMLEARKREALFQEWLEGARHEIYVKRMEF
jgi:peptidyl-prolyl cis-trans isomerase SurA